MDALTYCVRPKGTVSRLNLKIQVLQEGIDLRDAELKVLRELAHACIRSDAQALERLIPEAQRALTFSDPSKRPTVRRHYTPEFKTEICKQIAHSGMAGYTSSTAALVRKHSLNATMVSSWYKRYQARGRTAFYEPWQAGSTTRAPGEKFARQELNELRSRLGLKLLPNRPAGFIDRRRRENRSALYKNCRKPTEGEVLLSQMDAAKRADGPSNPDRIDASLLAILQGGDVL